MDNLIWKIKQILRKALPYAIIIGVIYGVYSTYRRGSFRHGIVPGVTSMLRHVPFFGSRFRHLHFGSVSHRQGHRHGHHRRHHRRR